MNKKLSGWQKPLDLEFLEKKPRVKAERVFAIIAFGDTTKFKRWTNHPFSSSEKHARFMVQLYNAFIKYRNGSGYFVKLLGDGLMSVAELAAREDNALVTTKILTHSAELVTSVNQLIKNFSYPRPDGFRVRLVAGDVLKLIATHPGNPQNKQIDYSAYPVSLAHTLLQVDKRIPCVCHESVCELLGDSKGNLSPLVFKKIKPQQHCPEGVDPDDMNVLWSFENKTSI